MITTRLKTAAPALLAAATLFLTACGSDETTTQATPPATTAASSPTSAMTEPSMTESSMTESMTETSESDDDSSETGSSTSESADDSSESTSESDDASETETSDSETSDSETSDSETSATGSAGAGEQVVLKAFDDEEYPAEVGEWVKAPGGDPGAIYDKGDADVVSSFLEDSDYASISTAVKTEKTPVTAGLCGGTGVEDSYTCYLETADGVINVSGDSLDDVVEFSNELAKVIGNS